MAPVVLPLHYTLSICNRSNIALLAVSDQLDGKEKQQRLPQPAGTVQTMSCQRDHRRPDALILGLLDGGDDQLVHQISITLPALEVAAKAASASWKVSVWPGATAAPLNQLHVLYRFGSPSDVNVLVMPAREPATFLSLLPNDAPLASLCLPGTHESLALYGWPVSTCQSPQSSITQQLLAGIRYLDVRLAPKGEAGKERLLAYHGITDERIDFGTVLTQCFAFLDGVGKEETIVMSLKQEQGEQDAFIKLLFHAYVDQVPASKDGRLAAGRGRWFLEDRVPSLGEARGKIVMLSRFVIAPSYGCPGGISPPIWPNSQKGIFRYQLRGSNQTVETQDWYDIGSLSSVGEKVDLIAQLCEQSGSDSSVLSLNYCNGSSFPFALPPAVAKGFLDNGTMAPAERAPVMRFLATQGVNARLRGLVAEKLFSNPQRRGQARIGAVDSLKVTFALDYYNEPKGAADLVSLLIDANF